VTIRNSVIMGADYYESPSQLSTDRQEGWPPVGIGAGVLIDGAIVDKNCHIGSGAQIVISGDRQAEGPVGEDCVIRDGILVVPKNAVIPNGWHI
jgi:glucose-1-phosphate adenylyltransferase